MRHSPKLTSRSRPSQLTRTRSTRGAPLHVHCCTHPSHSVCRGIRAASRFWQALTPARSPPPVPPQPRPCRPAPAPPLAAALAVPLVVIRATAAEARARPARQQWHQLLVSDRSRRRRRQHPAARAAAPAAIAARTATLICTALVTRHTALSHCQVAHHPPNASICPSRAS